MGQPLVRRPTVNSTAAKPRFNYRPRTAEEIRERQKQHGGNRDSIFVQDVQMFTAKPNDNDIRIMPPTWDEARHYGMELHIHYGIGSDESAYLCLQAMKGEKCPICEERDRAKAAGHNDYADSLRPSKRVAVYLIDRKEEGKGPLVWNMPWTVDRDISNLCIDGKTGEIYAVDNPDEGFDIQFKREGEKDRTKYTGIQIARRSSPLCDNPATMDKWLQHVVDHPLSSLLVFHEYERIAQVFNPNADSTSVEERAAASPRAAERAERREARGNDKSGSGSAASSRPRLQPRTPAQQPQQQAPQQEAPAEEPAAGGDKPSWEELETMNIDQLGGLGEVFGFDFPDTGFESDDALRKYCAEKLGVEIPAKKSAAAPAPKGDWRSRLKAQAGGK